jgi:hypothetical protein
VTRRSSRRFDARSDEARGAARRGVRRAPAAVWNWFRGQQELKEIEQSQNGVEDADGDFFIHHGVDIDGDFVSHEGGFRDFLKRVLRGD